MDRGFTLIELLVTVAVIGLLAGLAMLQARPNDGQQSLERAGNTLNGAVRLAQTQALADGRRPVASYRSDDPVNRDANSPRVAGSPRQ